MLLSSMARPIPEAWATSRRAGSQAAFGGVMEGMDVGDGAGDTGRFEDADTGVEQVVLSQFEGSRGQAGGGQLGGAFAGQDGGSLDGNAAGDDDAVAVAGAAGGNQAVPLHFAEHGAHDDGAVDAVGDFAVAADEGHADGGTRIKYLVVYRFGLGFGEAIGEQDGSQEPLGYTAGTRQVVGVDLNGVPADVVGGKGNGVGFSDEKAVAHVDDGGVFADLGAEEYTGVGYTGLGQEPLEELGRELSDFHDFSLLRRDGSPADSLAEGGAPRWGGDRT